MNTLARMLFIPLFFFALNAKAVDLDKVEKLLTTTGVVGYVHGAVADRSLYVFTYRNPNDFFDSIQMSLISSTPEMDHALEALTRNDQVLIKGKFLKNPSPQKHILVAALEMVKKYQNPYSPDPYHHEANLPKELIPLKSATFLVHAVAGEGHVLVVEFKDEIVPIFVMDPKNALIAKGLYRNDIVKLDFVSKEVPDQPTHLYLDSKSAKPIEVVESIVALHGKPASIEGQLVMFPKSPEIKFNVFAVEQKLQAGLSRQYTIVNFDDGDLFKQVRELLQKNWDQHPNAFKNARNKLVNSAVKVKITGTFNEVDQTQANPQILVKSLKDIQFLP
jgi:hypothetical protein